MNSLIDFRDFEPRFKSALIFSIFEGIREGAGIGLVCDQDPSILQQQFLEAKVNNVNIVSQLQSPGIWLVSLQKLGGQKHAGSCCGICGGEQR